MTDAQIQSLVDLALLRGYQAEVWLDVIVVLDAQSQFHTINTHTAYDTAVREISTMPCPTPN